MPRKVKTAFYPVLWCIYFRSIPTTNFCFDEQNLEESDFMTKITQIKDNICLDFDMGKFEQKIHLTNDLLFEKRMFIRLYEKKKKKVSVKKRPQY